MIVIFCIGFSFGTLVNVDVSDEGPMIKDVKTSETTPIKREGELSIDGVVVKLGKVHKEGKSIYIEYTLKNDTDEAITPAESLAIISSGEKQAAYDIDKNINNMLVDDIQPGVKVNGVMKFKYIGNTIDILMKPNFNDYRFKGVKVDADK